MNKWLKKSINLAAQPGYLDKLQEIYDLPINPVRDINEQNWYNVEKSFHEKDDIGLINNLLSLHSNSSKFPIKNSYLGFLKKNRESIHNNPITVKKITNILYSMGLEKIREKSIEPKETNQQIGPLFGNYLKNSNLGLEKLEIEKFSKSSANALLIGSDSEMKNFAKKNLDYRGEKGLDFLCRIKKKYIIGEAKFISDYGGNQTKSILDARTLLNYGNAEKILILDGVLYIPSSDKLHKTIINDLRDENILSGLLLRDFILEKINET